ncbi:branched-chain amino acid ABC transporter permease [Microbacterium sp. A93]|uniref:branched-chain amino acid ABC transporter permease n=1 Tax=Microbacterium sp. A93 TaxID=3450716 RepID=UPI003F41F415
MWQVLFQGVVTGLLYGIAGLGLVFIFRATGVVNFGQGYMLTLALFGMSTVILAGGPFPLALLVAVAIAAAIGLATNESLKLIKDKSELSMVMATLAIGLVIKGVVSMVWGSQTRAIELPFPDGGQQFGPVFVEWSQLITLGLGLLIAASAFAVINFTRAGLGMRAVFENEGNARLLGVPVRRLRMLAWAIGSAYAIFAAVLVVPQTYLNEASLVTFALVSFAAITIGGLSNMFGTLVGGILVGVVLNLVALYLSSSLAHTATLVLIVVVLFLRPQGLLSARRIVKV